MLRTESASSATRSPWQGELWVATDYALFCGVAGHTRVHRHYAHQGISLLKAGRPGPWQWVESLQPHCVDGPGDCMLAVYAEPMTYRLCDLQAVADYQPESLSTLASAMHRIARADVPERLQVALRRMDEQLTGKVSATELAHHLHVSQSHLQRLFDVRLGLSIRRMVLWRRLRAALRFALEGHSLTQAAHRSGFADSAHLSRTLRSMFGISGQQNLRHLRLHLLPDEVRPGAEATVDR